MVIHMMQTNILKMTGSVSFKYVSSLIDFNRLVQLRLVNTTTVAILKKRLEVIKGQKWTSHYRFGVKHDW